MREILPIVSFAVKSLIINIEKRKYAQRSVSEFYNNARCFKNAVILALVFAEKAKEVTTKGIIVNHLESLPMLFIA